MHVTVYYPIVGENVHSNELFYSFHHCLPFIPLFVCAGNESDFLSALFLEQVLLEASDLAGISVFLAMLIACTVAIILLPIETKGKSLRVSQCLLQEGLYTWLMRLVLIHLHCMYNQYCTLNLLSTPPRRLETCNLRRVHKDAANSLPLYVTGGVKTHPLVLPSLYDILYRHVFMILYKSAILFIIISHTVDNV